MNSGFRSAGWAILGGLVGSAIAYLTAPASGTRTRRRIARRVEDGKDELLRSGERAVGHATDYLEQRVRQGRRKWPVLWRSA